MSLNDMLTRPHIVFDVESFGLHGEAFAIGAVFGRLDLGEGPDGRVVRFRELQRLVATASEYRRPWVLVDDVPYAGRPEPFDHWVTDKPLPGAYAALIAGPEIERYRREGGEIFPMPGGGPWMSAETFNWLQKNIPDDVFAASRLTGDLSIHQLFDAFVEAAGPDVVLWGECPVPVESNFLRRLLDSFDARSNFWRSLRAPILHDVASLADPLGISHERVDAHKPAHDPILDALHSVRRLQSAFTKIARMG